MWVREHNVGRVYRMLCQAFAKELWKVVLQCGNSLFSQQQKELATQSSNKVEDSFVPKPTRSSYSSGRFLRSPESPGPAKTLCLCETEGATVAAVAAEAAHRRFCELFSSRGYLCNHTA